MRIVRFLDRGVGRFGCVVDDAVHELNGDPLGAAAAGERLAALADVRLLAPCEPRKVVAMAINFPGILNYSPDMSEPLVFIKPGTSVCAPGDPVVNPFPDLAWWGEAELGVVIRSTLRDARAEEVSGGVLGFTIGNDVTTENVDERDHHLARSKCPDTFCPLGPWIDTEFKPAGQLIEAVQNGEVIRRAREDEQIWRWDRIVAWISSWMTLEPWDVVLTGNPPDTVGMRYVEHGDQYTARVEGLGELTNRFFVGSPEPIR